MIKQETNSYRLANRIYLCFGLVIVAAIAAIIAVNVLVTLQLYAFWRADAWYLYEAYLDTGMPEFMFHRSLGHPMVFHKLLTASDWSLFDQTGKLVTLANILFNAMTAGILWLALWQSRRGATPVLPSVLSGVLLTGSIFWMTRALEFTYPSQIGTTLVIAGTAMAAYCLYRHLLIQPAGDAGWPRDHWWWLMIASCLFASFTFGNGIASWAGIFMALVALRVMPGRILLLCGIAVGTVIAIQLMPSHEEGSMIKYLLEHLPNLRQATEYLLIFNGLAFNFALFTPDNTRTGYPLFSGIVGLIGIVILTGYTWWTFSRKDRPGAVIAIPLALGWFALAAGVFITIGRAGMEGGWGNPVQHRYPGWSVALWAALLWLALYHLQPRLHAHTAARIGLIGLAVPCLILFASASYHGISYILDYHRAYQPAELAAVVAPETRIEDLRSFRLRLHLRAPIVEHALPEMKTREHGLFRKNWTRQLGDALAEHYAIEEQTTCTGVWRELHAQRLDDTRVYEGWATGPKGSFDTLIMVVDGKIAGGGKPVWLGDVSALGQNSQVSVASPRRYFLGMLFGHTPGWLGMARVAQLESGEETEIEVYGLLNNNTVCRIGPGPGA